MPPATLNQTHEEDRTPTPEPPEATVDPAEEETGPPPGMSNHHGSGPPDTTRRAPPSSRNNIHESQPRRPRSLLHLFSGPERPGSLQEHIEALGWRSYPVDTSLEWSLQAGNDLSSDAVWEAVEYMIDTGQVHGVAMDPPCSTCSRARKHPPRHPSEN